MHNLAIIPARGGSKRIPRKNILEFHGKPIIAYSIKVALESGLFEEVMVSTEDKEIAEIAVKFGARVPFFRSTETASDFATTFDVLKEVFADYKAQLQKEFDYVCCIYPTAPLIKVSHLKAGYDLLLSNGYDSVFPVIEYDYPVWRALERNEDGRTSMIWQEYLHSRSQDLKPVYHDAGQWYWINIRRLKDTIFTNNSGTLVLDENEAQDIDTLADWKLAEMKYRLLHET